MTLLRAIETSPHFTILDHASGEHPGNDDLTFQARCLWEYVRAVEDLSDYLDLLRPAAVADAASAAEV